MKKVEIAIKVVLGILFLLCLLDWNYGYYQLVRFIGMVGFSILAFNEYSRNQMWFVIWLASAVLINPIFKISLGREIWNVVDVLWAITLFSSIVMGSFAKRSR